VTAWIRRHPAAAFLPLQAILCFWNLGMLSPWMDEAGSLRIARLPLPGLIRTAASDVNPAGYYLLLFVWQRLPLGLDEAVQARALSVIFLLAAGAAADHFWASRLPERARFGFLALWTFSPCLLLYGRMSRSYSLQVLVVIVGAACLERFCERPGWPTGAALAGAVSAALYIHYVPGLALLGTANLALLRRRRVRDAIAIDGVTALAYLPWMWTLAHSFHTWSSRGEVYALTGVGWLEVLVKLAYWGMSFTAGEALPDWAVVACLLLIPWLIGLSIWLVGGAGGAGGYPACLALSRTAWPLTAIGLIGVARWVSYPFIPARMLFVLPFFLLLAAAGATAHRRAGTLAMAAMLTLSLTGIWCYFHKTGFRNKQYPMPMAEIAARISRQSTATDSVTLVDSTNSDPVAMAYAFCASRPVLQTGAPETESEIARRLADPHVRTVWFLRNTHDVSAGGLNRRFEALLQRGMLQREMRPAVHAYEPFSPLETWMMRRLGMGNPPLHFQELIEFRR
jgi:hypothetical protein